MDTWSKKNGNGGDKRPEPVPVDSQMPSLSGAAVVPHVLKKKTPDNTEAPPAVPVSNGASDGASHVEVHMVYAEWCGHSKNAKPAFEKLVNNNSVTTASGRPVKFVMTDEKSPNFKDFKVRGFPSYMVKDGETITPIKVGDRSEESVIKAAQALN